MTTKTLDANLFLTTEELAERWGQNVSAGTIENWRAARKGPPYVKLGRGKNSPVLYRLSDVIDYEQKQTVKPRG